MRGAIINANLKLMLKGVKVSRESKPSKKNKKQKAKKGKTRKRPSGKQSIEPIIKQSKPLSKNEGHGRWIFDEIVAACGWSGGWKRTRFYWKYGDELFSQL